MRHMGPLILLALAISLSPAQPAKEYQSSRGVVRVTIVPDVTVDGDSARSDSTVSDSILAALPDLGIHGDAVLEVYFLDRLDGQELRFPARYSQLIAFEAIHPGSDPDASAEDRAIGFIREYSRELRIHMKTQGIAGSKQ